MVLGTDPSLVETLLARLSAYRPLLYISLDHLAERDLRLGHYPYENAKSGQCLGQVSKNRANFSFRRAQILRLDNGAHQLQFFLKQARIRCLFLAKIRLHLLIRYEDVASDLPNQLHPSCGFDSWLDARHSRSNLFGRLRRSCQASPTTVSLRTSKSSFPISL